MDSEKLKESLDKVINDMGLIREGLCYTLDDIKKFEDLLKENELNEVVDELTTEKCEETEEKIVEKCDKITFFKPKYQDGYYYINLDNMSVNHATWYGNEIDYIRFSKGVVFNHAEEADYYLDFLKECEIYSQTFTPTQWDNAEIQKWTFCYDCDEHGFTTVYYNYYKDFHSLYFRSKEECLDFIKKYEPEIKRYMRIR